MFKNENLKGKRISNTSNLFRYDFTFDAHRLQRRSGPSGITTYLMADIPIIAMYNKEKENLNSKNN